MSRLYCAISVEIWHEWRQTTGIQRWQKHLRRLLWSQKEAEMNSTPGARNPEQKSFKDWIHCSKKQQAMSPLEWSGDDRSVFDSIAGWKAQTPRNEGRCDQSVLLKLTHKLHVVLFKLGWLSSAYCKDLGGLVETFLYFAHESFWGLYSYVSSGFSCQRLLRVSCSVTPTAETRGCNSAVGVAAETYPERTAGQKELRIISYTISSPSNVIFHLQVEMGCDEQGREVHVCLCARWLSSHCVINIS